jgi:hypothetical protein
MVQTEINCSKDVAGSVNPRKRSTEIYFPAFRMNGRLDADVLAWLKKDGHGYQTRANRMLRDRMLKDLEGR